MQIQRRGLVRSLLAFGAAAALSLPAFAQTAGKDYNPVNPPQPTDDPAKVEVIEFFSYGCPHCSDFNSLLGAWAAKLPADVVFRKVPVSFGRAAWGNIGKLYYALETTGDLARLDSAIFKAVHEERVNLFDERTMSEWVVKRGVDPKKFADAYGSFGVMSKMKRADQLTQAYRIPGVPAVVVDGKYLVNGKDFNEQLAIADKLIAKARAEKSGKK